MYRLFKSQCCCKKTLPYMYAIEFHIYVDLREYAYFKV